MFIEQTNTVVFSSREVSDFRFGYQANDLKDEMKYNHVAVQTPRRIRHLSQKALSNKGKKKKKAFVRVKCDIVLLDIVIYK